MELHIPENMFCSNILFYLCWVFIIVVVFAIHLYYLCIPFIIRYIFFTIG